MNNKFTRWAVSAFIAAFCVYRLAVFSPLPLDSPGTLRPFIYGVFSWFLKIFDQPEDAFSAWSNICLVALLLPVLLAALHYRYPQGVPKLPRIASHVLGSRWLFLLSIAVCLLLCRFPTLLEFELNPDEGQFLASAHKLFYDPNFFHAVDCGTSGPLNIYPLMLPAIFGVSPDFASTRVIVISIIFLCAVLLYRTIALIAAEELARIAVLPFIAAFAVFQNSELVHYSSEHVPLLIITAALYLSVRVLHNPAKYSVPILLLGFLVTAAFFAKMQSVPIVAVEAVVALACVYATRNAGNIWRPVALFVTGSLPLPLLNLVLCVSAGVWSDFWMSYIRANSSYADTHSSFVQNLQGFVQFLISPDEVLFFVFTVLAIAVAYLFARMRQRMASDHAAFVELALPAAAIAAAILLSPLDRLTTYAFLAILAICAVPVYVALLYRRESLGADPLRWFGLLALTSLAAAIFSVYVAHHAFVHYLLLLFVPLCACVAWMLIRQTAIPFIALLLVFIVSYQCYLWSGQDDHLFRNVASTLRPPEGDYIRSITGPKGRIFVWGWTIRPYLGSGRVPSTRDTNVSNCFRAYNLMTSPPVITPTPESKAISEYYENRILRDLRANPPELFIDAVGPTSWFLRDPKYYGFEQFPEIAAFVKTNYVFLAAANGQRYYQRLDRGH